MVYLNVACIGPLTTNRAIAPILPERSPVPNPLLTRSPFLAHSALKTRSPPSPLSDRPSQIPY
ncbi:MAG: hypothetical protein F6K09_22540 [Merismopedia sp. SIO2A8]|nr:hypothetical protein [Merismopedia sp. SIO2A8]